MRLWSIKLEWLDSIGLVALWREALLAKKVLNEMTKGYRNHPQLLRFKNCEKPLNAINTYLFYVSEEALKRGFNFNLGKINVGLVDMSITLKVSQGQLDYELALLKSKLKARSIEKYRIIEGIPKGEPNRMFTSYDGSIEIWEKIKG